MRPPPQPPVPQTGHRPAGAADAAPARLPGDTPGAAKPGATPREVLTTLYRDRRRILAAFLGCLVLTVIVSFIPSDKYVAEASLLLRLGREYVYQPEVGEPVPGAPIAYDREQTLLAESRILTSRDVQDAVLNKLGLAQLYPRIAASSDNPSQQHTAALIALGEGLDAELLKGSNLLEVKFTHRDAAMSARVLKELIDAYLQKRAAVFTRASYGTAESAFVARSVQLQGLESRLAALKAERRIHAFGEEQRLLLAQRNLLDVKRAEASQALAQADGRSGSLRSSLQAAQADVTLSSESEPSEAIESARKQLLELTLKERELSARFKDNNLAVEDVRADLERTRAFIADLEQQPRLTVRSGRSPAREVAESDLLRALADRSQARAGAAALATEQARVDERLATFAASERELQALERDRRLAEADYEAAAKRLRDEMVLEELDRQRKSSVSIVESPQVPLQPKSLQPLILLVGAFLSLCAALLTAFLSALWRDTFATPAEVERGLGVPLLATVPMELT